MSLVPWEDAEDLTDEPAYIIEDEVTVAYVNCTTEQVLLNMIEEHVETNRCAVMFASPPRMCLRHRPCPIHD